MYGLIIASGVIADYGAHRAMIAGLPEPGRVYCADGGLRHAGRLGIVPDLILGDLDSADPGLITEYTNKGIGVEKYPEEKDYTDTELAAERAIRDGCGRVLVLGAFGGRADHGYANFQLVYKFALKGVRVVLADHTNAVAAIASRGVTNKIIIDMINPVASLLGCERTETGTEHINGPRNPKLSLFPVGGRSKGVSVSGSKYVLDDAAMDADYTTGVSNEFTGRFAAVGIREGAVFIMVCGE